MLARIGQIGIERPHRRIDPLDPQRAEIALTHLPVARRILHRPIDRPGRGAEIGARAPYSLAALTTLRVTGMRRGAALTST